MTNTTSAPVSGRRNHNPSAATIGGRGQEYREPSLEPMHVLTMRTTTETRNEDYFITAEEALQQRARRLKESKIPYTVDGSTLIFKDRDGSTVELTYREAS
jgi:hypothetical protein